MHNNNLVKNLCFTCSIITYIYAGSVPRSAAGFSLFGPQGVRFTIEELEQATKQFNESNLIGHGSFGSVYKGLLRHTVVAIKRRHGAPRQDFVAEV